MTFHEVDKCFKFMVIPIGFQRVRQHLPCLPTFQTEGSSSRGNLVTTVGFVTKSGMANFALSLPILTSHSDWIIVTGDTNQMTRDTINLAIYPQDCSRSVIINANGVSSPVVGIGTIPLSSATLFIYL